MAFDQPGVSDMLKHRRILIAEDEPLVAAILSETIAAHGGEVVGPFSSVQETLRALSQDGRVDAAVLDVRLRDGPVFEVADLLRFCNVPFGFASAAWAREIPTGFQDIILWQKPWHEAAILDWLKQQKPMRFAVASSVVDSPNATDRCSAKGR